MPSMTISKFKGVNRLLHELNLEPGEMTNMQGAKIDKGAIQSLPLPKSVSPGELSIPNKRVDKTGYALGAWNPSTATNYTNISSTAPGVKIAIQVSLSGAIRECLTAFLLCQEITPSTVVTMQIHSDDGGNVGAAVDQQSVVSLRLVDTDGLQCWRGCTQYFPPALSGTYWIVFSFVGGTVRLFGHPSNTSTTKYYDGATWSAWSSAFAGQAAPQFALVGTTTSNALVGGVPKSAVVKPPMKPWSGEMTLTKTTIAATSSTPTYWPGWSLCVLENEFGRTIAASSVPGTIYCTYPIWRSMVGSSQSVYCSITPEVSIVQHAGVIAATAIGVNQCLPLTMVDNTAEGNDAQYSAAVFQNNIAFVEGGDGSGVNLKPVYLSLNDSDLGNYVGYSSPKTMPFTETGTPDRPHMVVSFQNFLLYVKNSQYPFRMWVGNAGEIDSFDSYENVTDGDPILNVVDVNNELVVVCSQKLRVYRGVPGYATLTEFKLPGVISGSLVAKAMNGVFILCKDGLWNYSGQLKQIADKADVLSYQYQAYLAWRDSVGTFQAKMVNIASKHCLAIMLVSKSANTTPFVTLTMWLYDYWYDDWTQYVFCNTVHGLEEISAWNENSACVVDKTGTTALLGAVMEGSGLYSPFTFTTGMMDPNPGSDLKKFTHFTMDVTNPVGSVLVDITLTFDDGSTVVYSSVDLHTAGSAKTTKIEKQIGKSASQVQVTVSCNMSTLAPTTDQVKIHRMTVFYGTGKEK